jgi:hypothetical protein
MIASSISIFVVIFISKLHFSIKICAAKIHFSIGEAKQIDKKVRKHHQPCHTKCSNSSQIVAVYPKYLVIFVTIRIFAVEKEINGTIV